MPHRRYWTRGPFLLISSCLGVTLLASSLVDMRQPDRLAEPLDTIDNGLAGWKVSENQSLPPSLLDVLQPSSYLSRVYTKSGRQLGLFIAYYAQQRAGESMHSPKVCLPGSGWDIVQQGTTMISADGKNFEVNRYHIVKSSTHMQVLYWYQSRGSVIASEYLGKMFLFKEALMGGHTSGSIVRIILPDDSLGAAEGARFAETLIPQVQRCLGRP